MRVSGRELTLNDERVQCEERPNGFYLRVRHWNSNWLTWYKTMGKLNQVDAYHYQLEYDGVWRQMKIASLANGVTELVIGNDRRSKNSIEFISLFKSVVVKTAYCVNCGLCEAECVYRNIKIQNGKVHISDQCTQCKACLKILNGCVYYNSIKDSGGVKIMKGINRYLSIGVSGEWVRRYFADQTDEPGNRKTDSLRIFLLDAGVIEKGKRKFTKFGEKMKALGLENDLPWALMLCNLVYTPAFRWYVLHVPFDTEYTMDFLKADLADGTTEKAKSEFWNGFKVMFHTMPYGSSLGLAAPKIEEKKLKTGAVQLKMHSLTRGHWERPIPEVILYSLYKFSEACGGLRQFTLGTLLDDEVERDGISPTRIFGLSREVMRPLLNGLAANYPDFISVAFTLDLEDITLRADKTALDVLALV